MLNIRRILLVAIFATSFVSTFAEDGGYRHHDDDDSNESHDAPSPDKEQWCRFRNGTTIALGFTFVHTNCAICQCKLTRLIYCSPLQCLPAYCIDNKMPIRNEGQCCAQCDYEKPGASCKYDDVTYPHGSIIKVTEERANCWCQAGQIECRKSVGTIFEGFNLLDDGSVIYIIMIVLAVCFILGILICCVCSAICYNYYRRHQTEFDQVYEQYVNESGWQPVEEPEQNLADTMLDKKNAEAENNLNSTTNVAEGAAPPYATYSNGSFGGQQ